MSRSRYSIYSIYSNETFSLSQNDWDACIRYIRTVNRTYTRIETLSFVFHGVATFIPGAWFPRNRQRRARSSRVVAFSGEPWFRWHPRRPPAALHSLEFHGLPRRGGLVQSEETRSTIAPSLSVFGYSVRWLTEFFFLSPALSFFPSLSLDYQLFVSSSSKL